MKKFIILNYIVALIISLVYCCEEPSTSKTGKILEGKHYLNLLNETDYFLFYQPPTVSEMEIRLFIQFDQQTILHSFPISKVRFEKTDDKPHVRFKWKYGNTHHLDKILNSYVIYTVLCLPNTDLKFEKFESEEERLNEYTRSLIEGTSLESLQNN